ALIFLRNELDSKLDEVYKSSKYDGGSSRSTAHCERWKSLAAIMAMAGLDPNANARARIRIHGVFETCLKDD
ncbi:16683_t:CDS:2, partial [Rhizophagus irregularis]